MPIKITTAACKVGKLILTLPRPFRHPDIIKAFSDINRKVIIPPSGQGFLTNEGKFIDREEAFCIAREAGQLLTEHTYITGKQLFSEDLW